MSIRVDDTQLIAGAIVVGDPGLGVLGSSVPSTGDAGAGYAYAYLTGADANKEVRGLITSLPSAGMLTAYEDTSFVFEATNGAYSFTWQLYLDGVASGDPHTETLSIGAVAPLQITLDFPDTAPCSLLGYQVWSKLAVTDEEIAALWSE